MKRARPAKSKEKQAAQVAQLPGAEALRIKQIIDVGGQPELPTLLSLLNSAGPCEELYSGCKGKSGNPNCLCGLIPNPGSTRRAGLWAKQPGAVAELGPDPANLKREKPEQPVGLRNLGNTCYVNSVLQCLFASQAFRRAVYAARPPLAEQPVIKELRQLFVELEAGATSPVDPGPLAAALQLDHGVQQDGQEFMKLLLTLLEAQLARQPDLKGLIPSLFRGQSGYETVCQACRRPSESSGRAVNYYELDVPVKGFTSLQESLGSLLAPEFLCGNNQYFCDFCRAKVDATRQLRLRALPPMLCLSLQRFVFDYNKMDRVKASDRFAFPLELDMAPHLGPQEGASAGGPLLYDLAAILIHKGGSAMHGHYVAHINMDGEAVEAAGGGSPKGWWRFDDEGVSHMKAGPCSSADHGAAASKRPAGSGEEGGSGGSKGQRQGGRGRGRGGGRGRGRGRGGGTAAAAAAKQGGRGRGRGRAADAAVVSLLDEDSEGEDEEEEEVFEVPHEEQEEDKEGLARAMGVDGDGDAPAADGGGSSSKKGPSKIVSQNAYLLVYRRRGADLPSVQLEEATQRWLAEAPARLLAEYEQRCAVYAAAKGAVAQRTQQRQEEVRAIVEAAVAPPGDDPGHYISAAWLQTWADADGSSVIDPIDNSPLLCPHGKLDPSKTRDMRRISTPAWEQLRSSYKGGPELKPTDVCSTCLGDRLAAVAASEGNQERRDHFLALAASLEAAGASGEEADDAEYYVSKQWLGAWQKRGGRSLGTTSPTDAITCAHGHLAPEHLSKQSKRVGIPADFWSFLKRCWDAAVAERQHKQRQKKVKGAAGAAAAAASGDAEVVALDSDGDVVPQEEGPQQGASAGPGAQANGTAADGAGAQPAEAEQQAAAVAREGMLREFRCDSEECPACLVDLNEAAELQQGLRGRREAEKAVLAHLVPTTQGPTLQPDRTYNLVPASFMEQWRAYMSQAGRRGPGAAATTAVVAQPPSLAECLSGVLCECHAGEAARLAYPPPALVNKRGRWGVAEHDEGAAGAVPLVAAAPGGGGGGGQEGESMWQLLEAEDWQALVGVYGTGALQLPSGITATLRVGIEPGDASAATGGDTTAPAAAPAAAAAGSSADEEGASARLDDDYEVEIGDDYRTKRKQASRGGKAGWLEVQPPVCDATVAARRETARAARLTYQGAEVMAELVGSEEEARVGSLAALAPGGERKSKRARKGRAPARVDSTDTLRTLRLRLYEAVDVHPLNARIFVRGEEVVREDDVTLAECEIYPGEEIKVVDRREYDASDYASIVALYGGDAAGAKKGRQREEERGFHGTALHGLHAFGDGDGEQGSGGSGGTGGFEGEEGAVPGGGGESMAQD